jgi:hypothetical protein
VLAFEKRAKARRILHPAPLLFLSQYWQRIKFGQGKLQLFAQYPPPGSENVITLCAPAKNLFAFICHKLWIPGKINNPQTCFLLCKFAINL